MSESKHTPGPWLVTEDPIYGARIDAPGSFCVAKTIPNDMPIKQKLANARLIAAAPDLLDACRAALYALKGREHDGFLRDAIAKATGNK